MAPVDTPNTAPYQEEEGLLENGFYVYRTTHRIYYNTKNPVPIADVVTALQGLQGILRNVPRVITGLTGAQVDHGEFDLSSLESGSLVEDIVVGLFFKDKAEFDKFIAKIRENPVLRNTLVGLAIGAVATYGLVSATGGKQAPGITANNNIIINIGAGELKMTPEAFESIVRSAVGDKKETAASVLKFLAPAKADPASSVQIDGLNRATPLTFSPQAIAEAPAKLDLGKNEKFEELKNVTVLLRATDLDSKKTGWAGTLMGRMDRLKIELDPTVDESAMFGKREVNVDATLISVPKGPSNKLTPTKIYIRKIIT